MESCQCLRAHSLVVPAVVVLRKVTLTTARGVDVAAGVAVPTFASVGAQGICWRWCCEREVPSVTHYFLLNWVAMPTVVGTLPRCLGAIMVIPLRKLDSYVVSAAYV